MMQPPWSKLTLEYDGTGFRAGRGSLEAHGRGRVPGGARSVFRSWEGLAVAGRTERVSTPPARLRASTPTEARPPSGRSRRSTRELPDDVAVLGGRGGARGVPRAFLGTAPRVSLPRPRARRPAGARFAARPSGGRARSIRGALAAAALLVGEHEFRAFTPTETQHGCSSGTCTRRPGARR